MLVAAVVCTFRAAGLLRGRLHPVRLLKGRRPPPPAGGVACIRFEVPGGPPRPGFYGPSASSTEQASAMRATTQSLTSDRARWIDGARPVSGPCRLRVLGGGQDWESPKFEIVERESEAIPVGGERGLLGRDAVAAGLALMAGVTDLRTWLHVDFFPRVA